MRADTGLLDNRPVSCPQPSVVSLRSEEMGHVLRLPRPMNFSYTSYQLSPVRLLYAARALRGFGDGFAVIILPAYLSAIGYTPFQIGVVATTALLGSALLTLAVGFFAPQHDLPNLLLVG